MVDSVFRIHWSWPTFTDHWKFNSEIRVAWGILVRSQQHATEDSKLWVLSFSKLGFTLCSDKKMVWFCANLIYMETVNKAANITRDLPFPPHVVFLSCNSVNEILFSPVYFCLFWTHWLLLLLFAVTQSVSNSYWIGIFSCHESLHSNKTIIFLLLSYSNKITKMKRKLAIYTAVFVS